MQYELAKKLKDAGYEMDYMLGNFSEYDKKTANIWIPLDELIEACGEEFDALKYFGHDIWVAEGEDEPLEPHHVSGKTPEEAVAKLWLAINNQ